MFSICNLSQFKASQHVCDMPGKTNITLHLFLLYLFMPSLISWHTSPQTHTLTHNSIDYTQSQAVALCFCGLVWYCDCLIIFCQCFCFIYDSVVLINEIISLATRICYTNSDVALAILRVSCNMQCQIFFAPTNTGRFF